MKTVLITGTSSGIGFQLVEDFLNNGDKVIATLRDKANRESLFEDLKKVFPTQLFIEELDVTLTEDRKNITKTIDEKFDGKLDVLVNNAGYGAFGALEDFTEEEIRYQMEVNFFAPVLLMKSLLPALRNAKGKIVNISSIMGQYSFSVASLYSASKFALNGISEGLKYELESHGVQVITIEPGGHRTNFVKSIKWANDSFNESSPYYKQTLGLKGFMERLQSRGKAPTSDNVSIKVLNAVNKAKRPSTIVIGKDAMFVSFLIKLLPSTLFTKMMIKGNRAMLKGN